MDHLAIELLEDIEWSGRVVLANGGWRACCPSCEGEMRHAHEPGCQLASLIGAPVVCQDCDGYGEGICPECDGSGEGYVSDSTCGRCHGSGISGACPTCDGAGKVQTARIEVADAA